MCSRAMRSTAAGLIVLMLCCAPLALAWSNKEHIQLTRIAVARLLADPTTPPQMKAWLRRAVPNIPDMAAEREFFMRAHVGLHPSEKYDDLLVWSYMPDIQSLYAPRESEVEPFGVHERKLHYCDVELFLPGDAKRAYRHDLSSKPRIGDIPRDRRDPRFAQAGMLPFRIEHCYRQLVDAIRHEQLHAPTTQAQELRSATYWAGYLSHYLADNTQPHHASVDYKSQSYFANPRKAPNVHAELEYRMCDDEHNNFLALREEYWPFFVAALDATHPQVDPDPFTGSLQVSLISYDALPLIGQAAMKAAKQPGTFDAPQGNIAGPFDTEAFFRHRGEFRDREMSVMEVKALQSAWAVHRIEQLLRQAWEDAHE